MGGRGASSGGRRGRAPQGYRTVGKIRGISVIRDPVRGSGLPTKARGKTAYFGTNSIGKIVRLRLYGRNGLVKKDIDWTHSFDGHRGGTVHCHEWKNNERAKNHAPLSPSEVTKYKKAIEEASGRKDLIWEW